MPTRRVAFFRGIRSRMVALVLISIIPVVAVLAWQASTLRGQARDDATLDTLRLSRLAAERVTSQIDQTRAVMRLADGLGPVALSPGICEKTLAAGTASLPTVLVAFTVQVADGSVTCSSHPLSPSVNLADRPYFQQVVETGERATGLEEAGALAEIPSLVILRPVEGTTELLLGAALDLSPDLDNFLEQMALPEGSVVALFKSDATVIAAWPPGTYAVGAPLDLPEVGTQVTLGGIEGITEEAPADGVDRIYSYVDVAQSSESVFALVGVPTRSAFAAADAELRNNLLAALIVALAAIVVALLLSEIAVHRHLRAITTTVRRIGAGNLDARTGRRRAAQELTEVAVAIDDMAADLQAREASLLLASAERQRLVDELLDVQEQERSKIAADIHDDSIQSIVASKIQVQLLRQQTDDPELLEQLQHLDDRISGAIDRLRHLTFELEPTGADADLAIGIEQYVESALGGHAVRLDVECDDTVDVHGPTRQVLFRNIREASLNAVRHGGAEVLTVDVLAEGDGVRVSVADDGTGLDLAAARKSGHRGLLTMRDRAEALGGWFTIESTLGQGTDVTFWLPTDRSDQVPDPRSSVSTSAASSSATPTS